jgi:hypothetical protein
MAIARIPILTSVFPTLSNAGIPEFSMGSVNCIYTEYPDGRKVATQRYPINIYDYADVSRNSAANSGRGVYFWNFSIEDQIILFINNDKIYDGDYINPIKTITAGRDPVYFLEITNYLVILDPQNNQGWYASKADMSINPNTAIKPLHSGAPVVNWPFTGGRKMAGGGVVLNGTLYIMDTDGNIWNCAINDPLTWNGSWFIEASRSTDSGIFLASQNDQIVAISSKTIEFFYDAGNPTGSPLERRQDIFYNVGCFDRKRVFDTGDSIFFLGAEKTGTVGAYVLNEMQYRRISDDSVDIFLNNTISRSNSDFIVSGGSVAERTFLFITAALPVSTTSWNPQSTLVYDVTKGYWTMFETEAMTTSPSIFSFPIISNSERGVGLNESIIMFTNGDVFRFDMTGSYQDSVGYGGEYFADEDYMDYPDDYVYDLSVTFSNPITFKLYTPEFDADTYTNKFLNRMTLAGTTSKGSLNTTPIKISWTDDNYSTFSDERDLSAGNRRSLTRCGKFKRRAFKIRYTGTDKLLVEGIELDLRMSDYA